MDDLLLSGQGDILAQSTSLNSSAPFQPASVISFERQILEGLVRGLDGMASNHARGDLDWKPGDISSQKE